MKSETIKVRFDKNGFYHPAFGRLGRGRTVGTIYALPSSFAAQETIEIEVWDRSSKPPQVTGYRTVTRFRHLPTSAEIITDGDFDEMVDDALSSNTPAPEVVRPKVAGPEALALVTGKKEKVTA